MTDNKPPRHVDELMTKVKRSTARIRLHREAMAKLAADVAAKANADNPGGGANQ
jgi:hypothetical protein